MLSPLRVVGVCTLLPARTFTHNKLLGEGDSDPCGRSVDAECPMAPRKVSGDRNSSHPATDALSQGGLRPFGCSIWMHLDLRLMLPLGVQTKPLKTRSTGPYSAIPALHSWSQAVQTISQQVTLLLSSGCWAGSEMAHNQGIVVTTHLGGHESLSFGCRPYEQL